PEGTAGSGEVRTYSLMTNRFPDHTSLYVRVQDKDAGVVYATYSLGRTISFEQPQAEIDRANQLHVLHCAAPHAWSYARVGLNGQLLEHSSFMETTTRPHLVLSGSGYRVVMTGSSDVFVPLGGRVAIANSYRNGVFVCIHFNATGRSGASGIETYFYSRESLPLASAIHYYVTGGAPSANRGVRRRGYYVLRKTAIPAVLVECGFLTNP